MVTVVDVTAVDVVSKRTNNLHRGFEVEVRAKGSFTELASCTIQHVIIDALTRLPRSQCLKDSFHLTQRETLQIYLACLPGIKTKPVNVRLLLQGKRGFVSCIPKNCLTIPF